MTLKNKQRQGANTQQGVHLSLQAAAKYNIPPRFLTVWGKLPGHDLNLLQDVCQQHNNKRLPSELSLKTGDLAAMILITEILQELTDVFLQSYDEQFFDEAVTQVGQQLDEADFSCLRDTYLHIFVRPEAAGELHTALLWRELLHLWLANSNPAFVTGLGLFGDIDLQKNSEYEVALGLLADYAKKRPPFLDGDLINTLTAPARLYPNSLSQQLEYIKTHWVKYLGSHLKTLLQVQDQLKEEQKWGAPGPGPANVFEFDQGLYGDTWEEEPEAFTQDKNWMPYVVMLAKATYVWLKQLSGKYHRPVTHLNEIPDEELEELSKRGFNALWLIGVWERSPASKRIKHLTGNTDAIASAYSLKNYRISSDLGGPEAVANLQKRAWNYGLRVACDMVPNHTGLDADWLLDNPDWFMQTDVCPYPAYSFNSENLSPHEDRLIQLEDHYFDRTDAAVVFRYVETHTGKTRFIYHGNDGTSFPWNDTAQLNYMLPQVRRAVGDEIVRIARQFPIIRFDAAMTLAKRHYQRLWFPQPGTGGDIPSRSRFAQTKQEFNQAMPVEFWREVVDRIAVEAPDTLLLAEAFWMMEGYFVRSLGMHRVYNSAFMNMLRDEDNAGYRKSIFNIMEFNPQILKRFVNFMNNPDEEPAVIGFGDGDKYFGICLLMVTMPGLPMFGHGQVEGLHERYGMEYHSARWNEKENQGMIDRHRNEIFPLMRKRYLFAEVDEFLLFDFAEESGLTNDDVFAYTNNWQGQRSLVVYHNRYNKAIGWVKTAPVFVDGKWQHRSLGQALNLPDNPSFWVTYQDQITGLQYIRNCAELHTWGLHMVLDAYKYSVYTDFAVFADDELGTWSKMAAYLQGGGTPDLEQARRSTLLQPFLHKMQQVLNPQVFDELTQLRQDYDEQKWQECKADLQAKIIAYLDELAPIVDANRPTLPIAEAIVEDIQDWLCRFEDQGPEPKTGEFHKARRFYETLHGIFIYYSRITLGWLLLRRLGELVDERNPQQVTAVWFKQLQIEHALFNAFKDYELNRDLTINLNLLKTAIAQQHWWERLVCGSLHDAVAYLLDLDDVRNLINVHTYNSIEWFEKERFDDFIALLYITNFTVIWNSKQQSCHQRRSKVIKLYHKILLFSRKGEEAGFQVEGLLRLLEELK